MIQFWQWLVYYVKLELWSSRITSNYLHSFVLFGKHCSKDGSGRKSGAEGSTVCLFCLVLFVFVVGGSKVKVAWGPELKALGWNSLLWETAAFPSISNLGKKEVLGSIDCAEWLSFLHQIVVKVAWSDAIPDNYEIMHQSQSSDIKVRITEDGKSQYYTRLNFTAKGSNFWGEIARDKKES